MFANVVPSVALSNGPVCAVAVDVEEDFDWDSPLRSAAYSTRSMTSLRELQEIVGAYGIVPTYFLTYPILEDREVVRVVRRQLSRGQCEVGVQLHPWVNPPFDGDDDGIAASFCTNLAPDLEERKLVRLKEQFISQFGYPPLLYRAGRYGLSHATSCLLEKHGFAIDTSIAPRTISGQGGPDYASYDYQPFWFGEHRRLLEVPLCRSVVGWGGRFAALAYQHLGTPALARAGISSALTRLRFAERITLSPEGNDVDAMLRLVRQLRRKGQSVFVLSFHSSSLAIGRNPYVGSVADLHGFYDRLSAVLDTMASRLQVGFVRLTDLPGHFEQAPL